ncbi:hypothetical protein [Chryseobacterium arthrosphaerae]|uniref:hypothetical protein n=1 Tax=Chryseobacterium arthrosphaerae TaxID=651561 RepID=UPI001F4A9DBF|nr:hypothetical protein [Chryseobacterium arthrosphaerae]
MMRTAVPEQQKPDAIVFSRAVAEQKGTPVYQLLMKYRVKQKPNRRDIEADISEY